MNDLQQIKRQWQHEYAESYAEHCAKQLAWIDAGLGRAAREFLGNGDPSYGHVFARLIRERARLLGLDSPMRIEAAIRVTEYNTRLDSEIENLLAQFGVLDAQSEVVGEVAERAGDADDGPPPLVLPPIPF